MNMVLGPNGTGKSTIVAAIALGLGFPTSVLGRSNDIKEFVRHGQKRAVIELVIKCGRNMVETENDAFNTDDDEAESRAARNILQARPFITIRRNISVVNDKAVNEWFLNESPTSQRVIQNLVRLLNAQVDNMCQFLPQDKVGEFVRMNPIQMLQATEEAAARPGTLSLHRKLIELREEDRKINAALLRSRRQLNEDRDKVAELEERKRAAQELREQSERLKHLRRKRPWLVYQQKKDYFYACKQRLEEAKTRLETETKILNAPLTEEIDRIKESLNDISMRKRRSNNLKNAKSALEQARADFTSKTEIASKVKNELEAKQSGRRHTRAQVDKIRTDLRELDAIIREKSEQLEALEQGPDEQYKAISLQLSKAESDRQDLNSNINSLREEGARQQSIIQSATAALQRLDDAHEKKMENLRRINPHAYNAYHWLNSNENRKAFRGEVLGPLGLDLGVDEAAERACPELRKMVESCVSRQFLTSFLVTDPQDHETFMRECGDRNNLRINCILIPNLDKLNHACPWPKEELKSVGFDGVLLDVLRAPQPILQALCEVAHIHMIPFTCGLADERINLPQCEANPHLHKFVARDLFFELRRSRYGPDVACRSSPLKPEQFLSKVTTSSREASQKRELSERIEAAKAEQTRLQREMHALLGRSGNIDADIEALKRQVNALNEQRRTRSSTLALLNSKRAARETAKKQLKKLQQSLLSEFDDSQLQDDARAAFELQMRSFKKLIQAKEAYHSAFKGPLEESVEEQCLTLQLNHLQGILERNSLQYEGLRRRVEEAENLVAIARDEVREAQNLIDANDYESSQLEAIFAEVSPMEFICFTFLFL